MLFPIRELFEKEPTYYPLPTDDIVADMLGEGSRASGRKIYHSAQTD